MKTMVEKEVIVGPFFSASTTIADRSGLGKITIDTLPDDAFLEIFDVDGAQSIDAWQTLVHVCIRWRDVVSASARRLNL